MQDNIRQLENRGTTYVAGALPSNDNRRAPIAMGCSLFPKDAVARIYKPFRSAMTSGNAQTKGWRLSFERRTAPVIEPLMGWTSGEDTLTQVELTFPTLKSAIRYAERQGLNYTVQFSGNRPSCVDEVDQAPLALERSVANDRGASSAQKAA